MLLYSGNPNNCVSEDQKNNNMGVDVLKSFIPVGCLPSENHPANVHTQLQLPNRAKRSLFGPVNHEEIMELLNHESVLRRKEAQNKWCFNFDTGKPISNNGRGQYNWELVQSTVKSKATVSQERRKVTVKKSKKSAAICKRTKSSKQTSDLLSVIYKKDLAQTLIKDYMQCSKTPIKSEKSDCSAFRKKLRSFPSSSRLLLRSRTI